MVRACPLVPSAVGCDSPSSITLPAPSGVIAMLPADADTIGCPLTSNEPPSCGEVSATTLAIPPDPVASVANSSAVAPAFIFKT